MSDARRTVFGIVGSGWRSSSFLRIARELPHRFQVCGVVSRSVDTRRDLEAEWGIRAFESVEELAAKTTPEFVVVSVPPSAAPEVIARSAAQGLAVLTETPPAPDVDSLIALNALVAGGAVIQVAEQYHLGPLLAAQLAIAASGRLGTVSQAMVGQAHDYHGISIIRRALGIGYADAMITASTFDSPLVAGPGRGTEPREERVVIAHQTTARFDFGDRLGTYDFATEEYRSWIRGNRLLIRGERGEIDGSSVSYLQDFETPMHHRIRRVAAGEGGAFDGASLRGLVAGDEWVYRNPFAPARMTDDEIAMGSCLAAMADHVRGGPPFYSLAEASQDRYLALMMKRAAETGEHVTTTRHVWAA